MLITNRGEVVAELLPPGQGMGERGVSVPRSLVALARRGLVTLGAPNDPALYPELPSVLKRYTSQQLLDEERGPR